MPDEPEVAGLVALLLLIESRRASRRRPDGSLVLLGDQDRTRWDRALLRRLDRRGEAAAAYQRAAALAPTDAERDFLRSRARTRP